MAPDRAGTAPARHCLMIFFFLLVSVMPMVQHPLWSIFVGDFTIIKYLGLICLVYAGFYLALRGARCTFLAAGRMKWFVGLAILGSLSYFVKGPAALPVEISPFMSYLSLIVLAFVTLVVVDSHRRLRWVLLVAVGSVTYASLHVIREWQKYGGMAAGYRPGYVTGDPNYFALSTLICLPIAFYLLRTRQRPWERWFCRVSIFITLVASTLAASRGGLVGLLAAFSLVVWQSPRRARSAAMAIVVLLPLLLLVPASPLQRLLSPSTHDVFSGDERKLLWSAGLDMLRQHPLVGIGAGNFKYVAGEFLPAGAYEHIAHNTYIQLGAELGLGGLAVFLVIMVLTYRALENVRTTTAADPASLLHNAAAGLQVGLAGFAVGAIFVSAEYQRLYWFAVCLSVVIEQLARRSVTAGRATRAWGNRRERPGHNRGDHGWWRRIDGRLHDHAPRPNGSRVSK